MKNIHLIPTDKPSRLTIMGEKLLLSNSVSWESKSIDWEDGDGINQNIYITSDEKPKEGDWVLSFLEDESYGTYFKIEENHFYCGFDFEEDFKKVILTTDQDLIKDGVQSIDDEFLEWFVKNPTCEGVEVIVLNSINVLVNDYKPYYKIITPKEEPKQETLEEAAIRYEETDFNTTPTEETSQMMIQRAFINGARWQQERMYSEEEVEQIFNIGQMVKNYGDYKPYTFKEALKQIKKK